jgi:hypothetical protein
MEKLLVLSMPRTTPDFQVAIESWEPSILRKHLGHDSHQKPFGVHFKLKLGQLVKHLTSLATGVDRGSSYKICNELYRLTSYAGNVLQDLTGYLTLAPSQCWRD